MCSQAKVESPTQSELDETEKKRLNALLIFEKQAREKGYQTIAGMDEAGRGPLAGPVVAACCVIPKDVLIPGIDDSKKLNPLKRKRLYEQLCAHEQVCFGVGMASVEEIDCTNISQATILAMGKAVEELPMCPDLLLVDGMHLSVSKIPCRKIIKGDSRSYLIAAASILAKVIRDELMLSYHQRWPAYGFDQHKGYGTKRHLQAIQEQGPCEIHRMSFAPLKNG